MTDTFEIVVFGTRKEGEEKRSVIAHVGQLLQLDPAQAAQLFEHPNGVVLTRTDDEDKARRIVKALIGAGAACNYRTIGRGKGQWQNWELEQQEKPVAKEVFRCPACDYTADLVDGEAAPAICPECHVVVAKYAETEARRLERERIRNNLLAVKQAQAEQQAADAESRRLEALRKEIEAELRAELGQKGKIGSRTQLAAAAAAALVIGVGGSLGFTHLTTPDTQAGEPAITQPAVQLNAAQSLAIATGLVSGMGVQVGNIPAAAPMTNAGLSIGAPSDAFTIAPTAIPIAYGPAIEQDGQWYEELGSDPVRDARLALTAETQIAGGNIDNVEQVAELLGPSPERVALLTRIADLDANATPAGRAAHAQRIERDIGRLAQLPEKAKALFGAHAVQAGQQTPLPAATLRTLLDQGADASAIERMETEAVIASTYAAQGHLAQADEWFAAANTTLKQMTDPLDQLAALPLLARHYFLAADFDTAQALLGWARRGLMSLPASQRRDDIADDIANTYALTGLVDEAAMTTRFFFPKRADRDRRIARLARESALQGRLIAAQGLATLIESDAMRATTKARIAAVARYQQKTDIADVVLGEARREAVEVEGLPGRVVASELMRASIDTGGEGVETLKRRAASGLSAQRDASIDQAKAIIARNLAWVGDMTLATQVSDSIQDPERRLSASESLQQVIVMAAIDGD
jgi:hypothetical protein